MRLFFCLVVKFEAARAINRFFSVEFLDVAVPIMNFREDFRAVRAGDDAFVRELRVVFERSLAEQMRNFALSAKKCGDVSSRARPAFFASNTSSHFSQGNRGLQILMCM